MSFMSQPFVSAKVLATRAFLPSPKGARGQRRPEEGRAGQRRGWGRAGGFVALVLLGAVLLHSGRSASPTRPSAIDGVSALQGKDTTLLEDGGNDGEELSPGALTIGEDKEEMAEENTAVGPAEEEEFAARAGAGEVGEDGLRPEAEEAEAAGGLEAEEAEAARAAEAVEAEAAGGVEAEEAEAERGAEAVEAEAAGGVEADEAEAERGAEAGGEVEKEAEAPEAVVPAPTDAPLPPVSVKRWNKIGRTAIRGHPSKECLAAKPVPKYRLSIPPKTCKCGKLDCVGLDFPLLSVIVPAGEVGGRPAPLQAVTATLEAGRAVFAKHQTTEVLAVVPGDGTWSQAVANSRAMKRQLGSLLKGYRGEPLERAVVVHVVGGQLRNSPDVVEAALVRAANGHDVLIARPGGRERPDLQNRKRLASAGADCAGEDKRVSFLLEYFRRPRSVGAIGKVLAKTYKMPTEVIIHDDSQSEVEQWLKALRLGEGYLLEAGNVHEIRAYNRMAKMARGETIVLLQDDDLPPSSGSWLSRAMAMFSTFPKLGLLGGYSGTIQGGPYSGKFCPRPDRLRRSNRLPVPAYSGPGGGRFMFVTFANMGPFVMRRQPFLKMGLFNQNFSCRGEAGIGFDYEIGLRMWKDGYQVGLFNHGFTFNYGDSGSTGTRANPEVYKRRMAIEIRNANWYTRMHHPFYQNHAPRRGNGAGRFIAARRIEASKLAKVHQLVTEANTRIKAKRP